MHLAGIGRAGRVREEERQGVLHVERVALVVLLVVLVPGLARGQRLEVATYAAAYRVAPAGPTVFMDVSRFCDPRWADRPNPYRGIAVGGRVTVALGGHLGFDATIQRAHGSSLVTPCSGLPETETSSATVVALQPNLRLRLHPPVEIALAAGPALGVVNGTGPHSPFNEDGAQARLGIALSGRVTVRVGPVALEASASWLRLAGPDSWWVNDGRWRHLAYGLGVARRLEL